MQQQSARPEREATVSKVMTGRQSASNVYETNANPSHIYLLALQRKYGNRSVQGLLRSESIQARFEISQPDDASELEADAVADQIMRMPIPAPGPAAVSAQPSVPQIQRLCTACDELHRQAAGEGEEQGSEKLVDMDMPLPEELTESAEPVVPYSSGGRLQRMCSVCAEEQVGPSAAAPVQLSEDDFEPIQTGGQPMDSAARSFFEPRFGYAFDRVRIHSDSGAAESARAVNALAYTVGHNIVFGAGQYMPDTSQGKRLIAHELTHVVQQGAASALARSPEQPDVSLNIQPAAVRYAVLHRWRVNGPAAAATNTIVCDGSDGVGVQLGATGNADQTRCLSDCIRRHEESHRADALAANADLCKGKAANSQVIFNGEQKASEFKAYDTEINCLTPQIPRVGEVCKKIIQDRITQITPIRDSFK